MSNFITTIYIASLDLRRRRRHFDFEFFRPRHDLLCNFFLFLRHFIPNFIQMSPLNLARHFCGINWYLYSFLTALSRLVVCKFLVPAQTFWTKLLLRPSAANDVKWRLFAGKTRMYNVWWSVYDAKIGFYCSNEVILPLFFTEMFLLLLCF